MQPLLEIVVFILAILVCFYLPGKFLFAKLKLSLNSPEDLFIPFIVGIMLFTFVSYIFSWLKLEIIILPLFLIISFLAFKSKKWIPGNISKLHLMPLFIVLILAIIFSLSMLRFGVNNNTISYGWDDLWHLALINELKVNFPPDNPGFAEVSLKGYHFFYNFLLAKISNIFFISPLSLYFYYFPLFMALLWGIGVYALMFAWSRKVSIALWAVFLTMFGGSFAFILRLRGHENLSLDSAFGIQQPATALINPPFTISIIIVIATLFTIYRYLTSKNNSWLIPIALLVGLATMFKVYAGIILIGGFIVLCMAEGIRRRNYPILVALFASGVIFAITYGILRDPSSTLIFAPLWAPHSVLVDNMPWYGYAEKMYTYTKLSVIKGIIETELYSWYVFAFGNLGSRLIGLLFLPLFLFNQFRKPSFFALTVLIMAAISILIPLFFIQSGKVFEIIQMAWYFLFFISLLAAFGLYAFFELRFNKIIKIVLFLIIILLTLPSAYEPYKSYFDTINSPGSSLSDPYFKAMQFLKSEGNYNETILEIPDKNISPTQKDVLRWYRSSSPAIVAFANKRSYLSNEYIDFTGVDIAPRIEFIRKIILFSNMPMDNSAKYMNLQKEVEQGLRNNKIFFIYSPYLLLSFEKMEFISKVFENQAGSIYRVKYNN
ncbi:MAG: hypothetical protein Q7K54_00690 [Candidatus Parcubacteria bacterium]|nr:hypothetical protein [Candidatus Parcubacteria bacterium]